MTIPYVNGLSKSNRRVLSSLAIKVTFHPLQTLRQELVHPKDPIQEWQRKGVVYSVPCNECSRAYTGQTGRSLDHRIAEHRWALRNGDVAALALAEHVFSAGTKWIYPRQQSLILTLMPRPAAFLSPIQHERTPLNRGRRALPGLYAPCWIDIVLCFYYIFCFTLHLTMYICRSMLPY